MPTRLKKRILLACFGVSFIFYLPKAYSQTQTISKILFPNQSAVTETSIPYQSFKVYAAGEKVVVAGQREPEGQGEVVLYNLRGQELWRKGNFKGIPYISLGENSNKIILITDRNIRDERRNICIDENGNILWEKWVTSPGILQSPDGNYGITYMVSGEEQKGKFQIFDLSRGAEIPHPISPDYSYFYAKFIDTQRVALLLQKVKSQIDTALFEQRKEQFDKLIREKKGNKREIFKLKKEMMRGVRKEPIRTLLFLIYDITTQRVLIQKELVSKNGRSFYVGIHDHGNLSISSNGEYIAIAGANLSWEERKSAYPYVVQILNSKGDLLWERDDFDLITDTRFVEDKLVILDGKRIRIFNEKTGRELGNFEVEGIRRGRDVIQEAVLQNNKLIVQCSDITSVRVSTLLSFDLATGRPDTDIRDPKAFVLVWKQGDKGVLLDKRNRSLSFIQ